MGVGGYSGHLSSDRHFYLGRLGSWTVPARSGACALLAPTLFFSEGSCGDLSSPGSGWLDWVILLGDWRFRLLT